MFLLVVAAIFVVLIVFSMPIVFALGISGFDFGFGAGQVSLLFGSQARLRVLGHLG